MLENSLILIVLRVAFSAILLPLRLRLLFIILRLIILRLLFHQYVLINDL